jgi:hypothetical protein
LSFQFKLFLLLENVILLESKSQYIPVIDNNDDDISIHQQVSIYANDGSDTTIFPQLLSYSIPDSQCGVNMTGIDDDPDITLIYTTSLCVSSFLHSWWV